MVNTKTYIIEPYIIHTQQQDRIGITFEADDNIIALLDGLNDAFSMEKIVATVDILWIGTLLQVLTWIHMDRGLTWIDKN